jgi:hypothetical protein
MARPSRLPIGRLLVVCVLTLLVCAGILYVYVGWAPLAGEADISLGRIGYVAMGLALMAVLMLGAGIIALILSGRRRK